MNKCNTLECKNKLSEQLLKIGIYYDPKLDPVPKVHTKHLGAYVTQVIEVGGLTVVVTEGRANMAMEMIQDYEKEIRSVRKASRPPKVNGPGLVFDSKTPFTDLQKELDKDMGGFGIVLAIVFVIILFCVLYLLNTYA